MLAHTRFSNPEKINVYMGIERIYTNDKHIFILVMLPRETFRIPNFSINHIVRFLSLGKVILKKKIKSVSLDRYALGLYLSIATTTSLFVCFFSPLYEN